MESRIILVGAGSSGRQWAKSIESSHRAKVVAWVDRNEGKAGNAIEALELTGAKPYTDLEEAFRGTAAQLLIDTGPLVERRETVLAGLAQGMPVIGEKPMAASMADALTMLKAAEDADRMFVVCQSRRHNAHVHAFRRLVDRLGPLAMLNADFFMGPHYGGYREEMDSPLLLEMASQTFDVARFLSGADPLTVYCEEFNPGWSWFAGHACADALFDMTNGLRFSYRGSWCAEGRNTSAEAEWRAVGPEGSATWDGSGAPHAEIVRKKGGVISETSGMTEHPELTMAQGIQGVLRAVLDALEHGTPPTGECHDGIKSLAMVLGAVESSETGRRVDVAALLEPIAA